MEKAQAAATYQAVAGYEEDKAGVQAVEWVRREIGQVERRKVERRRVGEKKGDGGESEQARTWRR